MSEPGIPPVPAMNHSCRTGACCALRGRWSVLFWTALIGLVLIMQWPMIKGWYYRASPAPRGSVAWRTGFDAAQTEAAKTGKPLLLDFSASWCPPCQVMKHEAWPDAAVGKEANASYVPVMIDVDEPANAAVVQRYGIRAIPAVVVTDTQGNLLRQANYMTRDDLLKFLSQDNKPQDQHVVTGDASFPQPGL